MHDIHISIVSHKQFYLIQNLLLDLEKQECRNRIAVTVTINTPETIDINLKDLSFPVIFIYNSVIKGFAENHNAAFSQYPEQKERAYFLVINPDVQIHKNILTLLITKLAGNKNIGLAAPTVYDLHGNLEDSSRELPTPTRIIAKLFGRRGLWENEKNIHPDWVAGMFMAFPATIFQKINGFNENYFLYYEDVDICSRLWLEGYCIHIESSTSIIHDAQRRSWRNIKYLYWHIRSMLRFFSSRIYRKIKAHHVQRIK